MPGGSDPPGASGPFPEPSALRQTAAGGKDRRIRCLEVSRACNRHGTTRAGSGRAGVAVDLWLAGVMEDMAPMKS
eukprot:scaffold475048_cov45-Prasinocladus_malaysianus.AAC.1